MLHRGSQRRRWTTRYLVYTKLPGVCGELSSKYIRPEEALYGLKQSGLQLNDPVVVKLVTVGGMEQCKSDPCVFCLIREGKIMLILTVHVDDIAVAGPRDEVDKLLVVLNEDLTTNDHGELFFFTECVFSQDFEKGRLSMTQTAFIQPLARRFGVTTTSLYPASPDANLGVRMEGVSSGAWPYRETAGGLMWLIVMTRPGIGIAVRAVVRQPHNPTARHWKTVIQIIQHLLGIKDLGLTFKWGSGLEMAIFADANYADKADNRSSVSGVAVTLTKSVVSWSSTTQGATAL